MKKVLSIIAALAAAIGGFAQENHFDFSVTNTTGYELYLRIVDAENHQVEYTYPCRNNDNYWWGYIKPEGKLMLADTVSYNGVDYTVVAIGDHAFCDCSDLRGALEFPQTIRAIGAGAFKGCSNLNGNLAIPEQVTRIEDETFSGCSSLSGKLVFPDFTQYIGNQAFLNCSSFRGMMKFPATLAFIGDEAFKGCSLIGAISVKAKTVPTTAADAFEGINSWIEVDVPYNMKEAYRNAPGWSRFGNSIVEKSVWTGNAEPWTQGSGTESDPYLIESAENLAWLAKSVNEKQNLVIQTHYSSGGVMYHTYYFSDVYAYQDTCFRLAIDIDLRKDDGRQWTPIGNIRYINPEQYDGPVSAEHYTTSMWTTTYFYYNYFSGKFDGNDHSIDNYYIYSDYWESDGKRFYGLFGLADNASLSNLNTNNIVINIQQSSRHIGSVVGNCQQTKISNCHASGIILSGNVDANNGTANPVGGIAGTARACRIENCTAQMTLRCYTTFVGGIVGHMYCDTLHNQDDGIFRCSYSGKMEDLSGYVGGIVGSCKSVAEGAGVIRIENCFSRGSMTRGFADAGLDLFELRNTKLGGIVGWVENIDTLRILNCYSNDTLTGSTSTATNVAPYAGGIIALADANTALYFKNCYHVGPITSRNRGGILAQNTNMTVVRNCYFEQGCAPDDGFGVPMSSDYMKTEAFVNRLNNGSTVFRMDTEPYENGGYPVFGTDGLIFVGAEWYYEIQGENGIITYQHLQCVGDTTIGNERPKVIVRSNTQYDREGHTETTREYVYEKNGMVYWWNSTLGKFTVLYDFGAEVGDEWTIEVGDQTITTRVYASELQYIDGIPYKRLTIADPNNVFSGSLLSSIGHQTSFFPEKLMSESKNYRVEGLRCYWVDDELIYKQGDEDCDAIYQELHFGVEEQAENSFAVYPNPAHRVVFVRLPQCDSPTTGHTYRITNLMGQTLLQGRINTDGQQINIESLPAGMYFISVGETTRKFVVQ